MFNRTESLKALKARIETLKIKCEMDPEYIGHRAALDWQSKKYSLYIKQRGRCCFCQNHTFADSAFGPKKRIATLEHIQCRTNNGSDNIENLAISCWDCNNVRGTIDFDEFHALVKEHGVKTAYSIVKNIDGISRKERQRIRKQERIKEARERFNTDADYRARVLDVMNNAEEKIKLSQMRFYGLTTE